MGGAARRAAVRFERRVGSRMDRRWGARAWLEDRCDRDPHNPQALRPSSLKDYPLLLSNHILPGLGSIRLSELTPSHIEAWYWKLGARRIPRARAKA